jgi:HD-like signal output (HDOD) protein
MEKKILFVDDEPRVLDGIKRMLRPMRDRWDAFFANSGQEALGVLENERVSVLVTDMRMPGMDGAQLLAAVKEKYPHMVRIVLSGYSEQQTVFKSVKPAHQYLSKPCDSQTLLSTLEHASSLHDWLSNESIVRVISNIESLPSMPAVYREVVEQLSGDEASVLDVANAISKDVGMTAKLLQLVNSAFFGLSQRVTDMVQAVSILGLDTVKALVLSVHIFSQYHLSRASGLNIADVWRHSLRAGAFSRAIAAAEGASASIAGDVFTAGLLHDVGKLILAANFETEYRSVAHISQSEKISLLEAEIRVFATTHCEVGGYFSSLWRLPDPIVKAIGFHHKPPLMEKDSFSSLAAVWAANVIEHQSSRRQISDEYLSPDFAASSDSLLDDKIRSWRDVCSSVSEMELSYA